MNNLIQSDFSRRLNCSLKHLNNIINGKASITVEMSLKLSTVAGIEDNFWFNLQNNYDLDSTCIRLEKKTSE